MDQKTRKIARLKARRRKMITCLLGSLILLSAAIAAVVLYGEYNRVYKECYVEAGVSVTARDFLKRDDENAVFVEGTDYIDTTVPGDYHVRIKTGLFPQSSTLHVQDTVAPVAEAVPVKVKVGEHCAVEQFVTNVEDVTAVSIAYETVPDFTQTGEQTVTIVLTDLGGNTTHLESKLMISQVETEVVMEAGGTLPGIEAFVTAGADAEFLTDLSELDSNTVAEYPISIRVDGDTCESILRVADTVAPTFAVKNITSYTTVKRNASDFVTSSNDMTEISFSFEKEPDLEQTGTQEVVIVGTDEGNNVTKETATLSLTEDCDAPVMTGIKDLTVVAGNSISYKSHVTVTDNCEEGLEFTVDNAAVNLNTPGEYNVTYTAKDASGNVTMEIITVTVKAREYSEEEVNRLADEVLSQIITADMTAEQKVKAIYDYNMSHIRYISHSDKSDWVKAAYEGIADGQGDCYVYACTAKVLLTRAGITNMDIQKIPAKTSHYWNLVDIGDGWKHFDTTPRKDHPTIFLWNEAQMMEYSANHNNSHNYDHSVYPQVN